MSNGSQFGIVSLGVHKSSGGPSKTIGAFRDALDARLFTFCDIKRLQADPLAIDGAEPVAVSQIPGLKQFMVPSLGKDRDAELYFKESQLISCHSFYRYHTEWVNRMFKKYRTPYWFVPHGILDPWVMEKQRKGKLLFWKAFGDRFLKNAATVIFSTTAERDKAASQFELPGAEVVPWPVELVDECDASCRRQKVRSKLGIPEEARVLLYFGRVHSMKRPLETIAAMAQVDDAKLHLIMVGNPQDVSLQQCVAKASELKVSDRVHVVGAVYGDEKYDYLHAADAYISLSHRENFNHTAAESLSAGLPVILSPGNDLFSEIETLGCAWGLPDNEIATASTAIADFVNKSEQDLVSMGLASRSWVGENLSFEAFQTRLQQIACSIVNA